MLSTTTPIVATPAQPDRRVTRRKRVLKGAIISFNHGFGAMECTVRDEAPDGLRLAFADTFAVPPKFDLRIAGEPLRRAQVRWRSASQVGVRLD